MKILITGISGYLGSQLSNALITEHELAGTIRTSSNIDRLRVKDKIQFINLDDINWSEQVRVFKPDVVINTATLYGRKNEMLSDMIQANILFPTKLLECLDREGGIAFINCGSSLPPSVSSYALTKKQFVELANTFCKNHDMKFVNLRLEHFFGPFDDATKFTSYVIRQCLSSQPLKLTAGIQERDFIYIEDLISAFKCLLKSIDKIESGENIDMGSGKAIKVSEFVETVATVTKSRSAIEFGAVPMRENELMYSCAHMERMNSLGWCISFSLQEAVADMIKRDTI